MARDKGIRAQRRKRMLDAIPEQDKWPRANGRAFRRAAPQEGLTSLLLAERWWGTIVWPPLTEM